MLLVGAGTEDVQQPLLEADPRGLDRMDAHEATILRVLENWYGPGRATAWLSNWRVFFLSCAELWGYRKGREWLVSHYVFKKRT